MFAHLEGRVVPQAIRQSVRALARFSDDFFTGEGQIGDGVGRSVKFTGKEGGVGVQSDSSSHGGGGG